MTVQPWHGIAVFWLLKKRKKKPSIYCSYLENNCLLPVSSLLSRILKNNTHQRFSMAESTNFKHHTSVERFMWSGEDYNKNRPSKIVFDFVTKLVEDGAIDHRQAQIS
jgi:hypothetical protein